MTSTIVIELMICSKAW